MQDKKQTKMPLFSIRKRVNITLKKSIIIRIISIILSLLVSFVITLLVTKRSATATIKAFSEGALLMPDKLLLDAVILLGFGIAIIPAFRMKYWNMGANGQVLVATLISIVLMLYLGKWAEKSALNNVLLIIIMFISSIIISVIWAIIPAVFKALFDTNETLFTLMMNYIAMALVGYLNYVMTNGTKESVGIVNASSNAGWLPSLFNNEYILPIIVIIIMTVFVSFYMNKTKHGYEVIVCGDSINTAKYVGMNTKKIIIRTLILSGVLTGIIGFLYATCIDHTVTEVTGGLGFTAVLIAWLSNFKPVVIAIMSLFLAILTNGTSKISSKFRLGSNNLSNVIIGLIFFSILVSEFFIRYHVKINFRRHHEEEVR